MKTAVLLTGHLRHFERSLPTIINKLIRPFKADVYAWVWSDVGSKDRDGVSLAMDESGVQNKDRSNFDIFRELIPDVKLSINEYSEYHLKFVDECKVIGDFREKYGLENAQHRPVANRSQWFTWYAGFKMIEKANIEYDLVIRTRPDCTFLDPVIISDPLEKIYVGNQGSRRNPSYENYYELHDLLTYGNMEDMKKFCSLYIQWDRYIDEMSSNKKDFDIVHAPHRLYTYHLSQMNLDFEQVKYLHHVCREPLCTPCKNLLKTQDT